VFTTTTRRFTSLSAIVTMTVLAAAALGALALVADRQVARPIVRTLDSIDPGRPHFVENLTVVAPWRPQRLAARTPGAE